MMTAACPTCGAELSFVSKASLYAVCSYCSSLSVRRDLDVEKIGEVSAIQEDLTPIQLDVKGRLKGQNFKVIGRIQVRFGRGTWNEWHLQTQKGEEAWLGEAQGNFVFTKRYKTPENLPQFESLRVGHQVKLGRTFYVRDIKVGQVVSGEGELPFEVKGGYEAPSVDLVGSGKSFATLDYSEEPPILFVGTYAKFDQLHLRGLRNPMEVAKPKADAGSLQCGSCGHPLEIRAPGQTQTIACPACSSILDAQDPQNKVIKRYQERLRPLVIPLGQRGKLRDVDYTCIAVSERQGWYHNETWNWMEYLLWNPYHGYRYLSTYDGHWSLLETCTGMVSQGTGWASYEGEDYKDFQTTNATTTYAVGEFPFEVRRGDEVIAQDFINPPLMMSREESNDEIVWTKGEYVEPEEIGAAFGVSDDLAEPQGVFANMPSPYDSGKASMKRLLVIFLALAFLIQLLAFGGAARDKVFEESFTWTKENPIQISDFFELSAKSNVQIRTRTDIRQGWGYFSFALINEADGEALNVGKSIEYYTGSDYKEGSPNEKFTIGSVPPGNYYLRIEGQGDRPQVNYSVTVTRDVTQWQFFLFALCFLVAPYLFFQKKRLTFEKKRWEESDHPIAAENDTSGCLGCLGWLAILFPTVIILVFFIRSL